MNVKYFTFLFLFFLLLFPTSHLLAQAVQDPNTIAPKNITVQARVGSLVPGPIEPAPATPPDRSDDEEDEKKTTKAPTETPSFTLFPSGAEEQYQVDETTNERTLRTVFASNRPSFFGTANVPGAILSLQFSYGDFSYSASTRVNESGNWQWDSPKSFPNGTYTLTSKLLDPFTFKELASQEMQFAQMDGGTTEAMWSLVPLLEEGQEAGDIIVTPVSGYERVTLGEVFKARIHLFGINNERNIVLEYIIVGPNGEVYLRQTEALENRTSESFVKPFFTKTELVPGKYVLLVRAVAGKQVALGSTVFHLDAPAVTAPENISEPTTKTSPVLVGLFSSILVLDMGFFWLLFRTSKILGWHRLLFGVNNLIILILFLMLWKGPGFFGW